MLQARQAGDFASRALMQPEAEMPFSRLQGRVKFAVQKLADEKVRFSFGVLEAIDLAGKPDDPFAFTLAKSDPAVAVTADGPAKQLTFDLAWPRTDVRAPWDPQDTGARNTDLQVPMGGLTGKSTLTAAAEQVAITGLGVGPSFVAVRGSHIVDLSFNPSHGNKLDLTIKMLPGDEARFELAPRLDLGLAWKLKSVAAELTDPPAHLLDETWSLLLAGASPVVVETVKENTAGFAGGFKLVAGSLTLSSTAAPAGTVSVPTGKCLSENAAPPAGAHPLLGALASVDCP